MHFPGWKSGGAGPDGGIGAAGESAPGGPTEPHGSAGSSRDHADGPPLPDDHVADSGGAEAEGAAAADTTDGTPPDETPVNTADDAGGTAAEDDPTLNTHDPEEEQFDMAMPTPLNGQITDSVTQANVQVLGDAPAMAVGTMYQSLAQSVSLSFQNAVSAQQQAAVTAQAATTQGVMALLGERK